MDNLAFLHCTTEHDGSKEIQNIFYVDDKPISIGHAWIANGVVSFQDYEFPTAPGTHCHHSVIKIKGLPFINGKEVRCESASGDEISVSNGTMVHIITQPSRPVEGKTVLQ